MPLINFAGIASGIDSNALIDALTESAKQARVKPNEDKISKLKETNDSLTEAKTKATELRDYLADYTTAFGGILTKQVASSDETVVTGEAGSAATNGTYSVTISTLAKNANFSFNDQISDPTATVNSTMVGGPANVTVTIGQGTEAVNIVVPVSTTTTWQEVMDAINNDTNANGRFTASMVNVGGTNPYRLMLTTLNTGLSKGALSVSVDAAIRTTGNLAMASTTSSAATNAAATISGISGSISSATNDISIIPGVILKASKAGTATVVVSNDVSATQSKIQGFIDKFNDLVNFIKENNVITRKEDGDTVESIFGSLASTRVDDNLISAIRTSITSARNDSGSQVKIFADMGIKTERDGTLSFNLSSGETSNFNYAMAQDPTSVNEVFMNFADLAGATGGSISQFVQFNGLIDLSTRGNQTQIDGLNQRIASANKAIEQQATIYRQRFAALEKTIGKLNSAQSALTSALGR